LHINGLLKTRSTPVEELISGRCHCPSITALRGGRWLTILMNRIDPVPVCEALPHGCAKGPTKRICRHCKNIPALPRPQPVQGGAPHLVSAHATTARLVLGQEAVSDKSNETTAIRSGTELKSLPFRCPLLHCVGQT
jgi:hypothetical protein